MNQLLPKLLIIDDEDDLTELLGDMLAGDFQLTVSSNPEKALEIIKNNKFDLIITDLNMPTISGYTVIDISKEFQKTTPILVMTGAGEHDPASIEALKRGATGLIIKPFKSLQELIEIIKRFTKTE